MNGPFTFKQVLIICVGVSFLWIIFIIYCLLLFILGLKLDMENWAHLADTLNGFSAPIIGIVATLVVAYTLKVQVNANRLFYRENQKAQANYDIENLNTTLKKYIDNFCADDLLVLPSQRSRGIEGVRDFIYHYRNHPVNSFYSGIKNTKIDEVTLIFKLIAEIFNKIKKADFLNTSSKFIILRLQYLELTSNIPDAEYFDDYVCNKCKRKTHSLELLAPLVKELEKSFRSYK